MANTTADKLAKLESTKSALKTAINGSGNIVGDVFSDYPGAVDDFRSKVSAAITAKGVATNATDTPDQMAANIGAIPSGSGLFEQVSGNDAFNKLMNEGRRILVLIKWIDSNSYYSFVLGSPLQYDLRLEFGFFPVSPTEFEPLAIKSDGDSASFINSALEEPMIEISYIHDGGWKYYDTSFLPKPDVSFFLMN